MVKKIGFVIILITAIIVSFYLNDKQVNKASDMEGRETILDNKVVRSKVVEAMSVNEKIGQMIFAGISGTTMTSQTQRLINQYKVGGIILYSENMQSPKHWFVK